MKSFQSNELLSTVALISSPGKGILAADESTGTMGKRFVDINTENNFENRRKYRQLLFTTEGIENCISGIILYEETVYQSTDKNVSFMSILKEKNIVPIIKLDKGLKILPGGISDETITIGLDDLDNRCREFYAKGCRAAKWRAVFKIDENNIDASPSALAMDENAHTLAR